MTIHCFDYSDIPEGSRIGIYGSGTRGRQIAEDILRYRSDVTLVCFLDSYDEQGNVLGFDKRLFSSAETMNDMDLVLIASAYMVDIYNSLRAKKVPNDKIAIYAISEDFFPRQAMVSHRHKFIYVPSTKVAHTSFKSALDKYCENGIENIDFTESKYENYYKFAFVRSPYSRIVSVYNDKIRKPNYVEYFNHVTGGSPSFSNIIRSILSIKHGGCEPHWIPQSFSIWTPDSGIVVDKVFRLEELKQSLEELSGLLGVPVSLPHSNKSEKSLSLADVSTADRKIIYDYYNRDFEILGYPE